MLSKNLGLAQSRLGSIEAESSSRETFSVNLNDEQVEKIASVLKATLDVQLTEMVSSIVTEVMDGIQTIITSLQNENEELCNKVKDLEKRVDTLEYSVDKSNQYSRRNCLRLSGVTEHA
ncbi:hypothetical protein DPMN_174881 [Dreissena polymorpha]|uniref:Uncharacterized protein n=1 Tax=Dreissena polymorpha TaxID=45954 RepID=A0A9D4E763_DREPO|nr:hypothetical protein DPMN_174881 [Dreissena polymorpha]